jgi:hypothetical protein
MTTYITINKHIIAANARHGRDEPPIRVAKSKSGKPVYARSVKINGPSQLLYDAGKPLLKCGARLAIATEAEVEVVA